MVVIKQGQHVGFFCPECSGYIINVEHVGETVCSNCGLIISEREVNTSQYERRIYDHSERTKKCRVGPPLSELLPDISLCTSIDRKYIRNADLKRAVKHDNYISWDIRNLLIASTELKRISTNLNIPYHARINALNLYKRVLKSDILRGRSIKGMVVACLYYACKERKIARTFQDFVDESPEEIQIIKKCYKKMMKKLQLKTIITNPKHLIPRHAKALKIPPKIEKKIIDLISQYTKTSRVQGKNPKGLCAGAIYLVCKMSKFKISQKLISEEVGITEVTLRSRYKELLNYIRKV